MIISQGTLKKVAFFAIVSIVGVTTMLGSIFGLTGCSKKPEPSNPDSNIVTPTPNDDAQQEVEVSFIDLLGSQQSKAYSQLNSIVKADHSLWNIKGEEKNVTSANFVAFDKSGVKIGHLDGSFTAKELLDGNAKPAVVAQEFSTTAQSNTIVNEFLNANNKFKDENSHFFGFETNKVTTSHSEIVKEDVKAQTIEELLQFNQETANSRFNKFLLDGVAKRFIPFGFDSSKVSNAEWKNIKTSGNNLISAQLEFEYPNGNSTMHCLATATLNNPISINDFLFKKDLVIPADTITNTKNLSLTASTARITEYRPLGEAVLKNQGVIVAPEDTILVTISASQHDPDYSSARDVKVCHSSKTGTNEYSVRIKDPNGTKNFINDLISNINAGKIKLFGEQKTNAFENSIEANAQDKQKETEVITETTTSDIKIVKFDKNGNQTIYTAKKENGTYTLSTPETKSFESNVKGSVTTKSFQLY